MKKRIAWFVILIMAAVFFAGYPNANAGKSAWKLVNILPDTAENTNKYFDMSDEYGYAGYITTDTNGNLYVLDGKKIVRFTPDGKLDTAWGKKGYIYPKEPDSPPDIAYDGFAADSKGRVYVICNTWAWSPGDGPIFFIKRYTPGGDLDMSWFYDGMTGSLKDGLAADKRERDIPYLQGGIAVDSGDNLCFFGSEGVYVFSTEGRVRKVLNAYIYPMLFDKQDRFYLYNDRNDTVVRYNLNGEKEKELNGANWCGVYDAEGSIYSLDTDTNKIRKFTSDAVPDQTWCDKGVMAGPRVGDLESIISMITVDNRNNLYVLDGADIIRRYTKDGKLDTKWGDGGVIGDTSSIRHYVADIAAGNEGNFYVLDVPEGYMSTVLRYDKAWKPDEDWNKNYARIALAEQQYIGQVNCIVADASGRIYIAIETYAYGLPRFSALRRISDKIDSISDLRIPYDSACIDKNGYIYENLVNSVQRIKPDGEIDRQYGEDGKINFPYQDISDCAIDPDNRLYACDHNNNCIMRFTPQGKPDTSWGVDGVFKNVAPSNYYLMRIAVDGGGNLYVAYDNRTLVSSSDPYEESQLKGENRIVRYKSNGSLDTSWCPNGESSFPGDSDYPEDPARMLIVQGKLYAVWNGNLYVMDDDVARIETSLAEIENTQSPVSAILWLYLTIGITGIAVAVECNKRRNRTGEY